ncbi:TPA: MFS transporter [Klebsiella pneumoniae]|nr:MFS transporter [Klebsiella pneumoniae]
MSIGTLSPVEKKNFISFFIFFFFYYFIMSAYFPFFPVWLADVNHLSKTETGIVFSCVAFFGILFQFLFGYITDNLGYSQCAFERNANFVSCSASEGLQARMTN